jgi:hypothetical protein
LAECQEWRAYVDCHSLYVGVRMVQFDFFFFLPHWSFWSLLETGWQIIKQDHGS